ncbi:Uu.00g081930.m01.CDS01 [Anthostomella pinea]|uniref:Uu.00g081930.m01.CDS01 n=1 Tax=Anthostomella pinea TaxID=933095 RepID=A0AAI8YJH3_9PEZI|nr:Uu.00g081930.m01.CDS01 [Anthostomella pinea]
MESNGYSQTEALLEPLTHINREHLAAITEAAVADHDFGASSPSSPGQKRKRGAPDSSPDSRRAKRTVPTAPMSSTPDPASAAYVESAVEAAQAAAQAATHADFAALQQATADRHDASDPANASSTAAAALGTLYPTLHIPQPTEETFAAQVIAEEQSNSEPSFGQSDMMQADGLPDTSANSLGQHSPENGVRSGHSSYSTGGSIKPAVGSEEWHKLRKDNHKEVERRRRETINEGINELAKIVPACEKNKGQILQRAVAFITQLKENEAQNIEKWTLEKLLTEQAIQELSASNDKLKQECERAYRELMIWKQVAQNAGLEPPQAKLDAVSSS